MTSSCKPFSTSETGIPNKSATFTEEIDIYFGRFVDEVIMVCTY
jgi:hypothetical protein